MSSPRYLWWGMALSLRDNPMSDRLTGTNTFPLEHAIKGTIEAGSVSQAVSSFVSNISIDPIKLAKDDRVRLTQSGWPRCSGTFIDPCVTFLAFVTRDSHPIDLLQTIDELVSWEGKLPVPKLTCIGPTNVAPIIDPPSFVPGRSFASIT